MGGGPGTPARVPMMAIREMQVGSNGSRINYPLLDRVFCGEGLQTSMGVKREMKKKPSLGIESRDWNASTMVEGKETIDLKRRLLKVRAGLANDVLKPSKALSEGNVAERTIKAPPAVLSPAANWNVSCSTRTKEDAKHAMLMFEERERRRKRVQAKEEYLDKDAYIGPSKSVANINDRLRERKIDFQDLKDQFKRELKVEFPTASEERLQAMAQRLCNEKLLADEKMARFPVQHESFRPNLALTTQDRRYKEYHHPGTWSLNETEKRFCWSCCLNFGQESRGCEYKIVNPDAWCTLGYERRPGMAAAGKA